MTPPSVITTTAGPRDTSFQRMAERILGKNVGPMEEKLRNLNSERYGRKIEKPSDCRTLMEEVYAFFGAAAYPTVYIEINQPTEKAEKKEERKECPRCPKCPEPISSFKIKTGEVKPKIKEEKSLTDEELRDLDRLKEEEKGVTLDDEKNKEQEGKME